MPRPFHIDVVAEIERKLNRTPLHFIHDGAVIDAVDWNIAPVAHIEEPIPALDEGPNIHRANADPALRQHEIVAGFLPCRVHLSENHILRIMPPDNGFAHNTEVL